MPDTRLSLKEMCARFEVTPRTLRHYEFLELLAPEREGRARFYGPREIARLRLILRGRRFGFSLEEARQWLLMYDADVSNRLQMEAWIEMSGKQIAELEKRREQLTETIDELRTLRQDSINNLAK